MAPPFPKKQSLFPTAEAVEQAFYDAMQRGDHTGLMSLWADDDEVVCVHPGQPRIVGTQAVSASWKSIFDNQGGVPIRPTELKIVQSPSLSIHSVIEEVMDDASQQVLRCTAVNIYAKDGNGWRLMMHHSAPTGVEELTASSFGASLH